MIYFTADTHFNHINIIKYCKRPFNTVEEMNEVLVNNWNKVIKSEDVIYHLGDFGFGILSELKPIYDKLNGHKRIILGSHDDESIMLKLFGYAKYFEGYRQIKWHKELFVMCHYAMRKWPKSHYGSIHLFGHSHGKLENPEPNSMDVGVDCNNFKPISIEQVIEMMKLK